MDKKEYPLISIIIPVYNVEKYIRYCLESVISQTYSNLEIICIDDGSTDRSGVICDEYAKIDDRIVTIHQKNAGLSAARNAGLKLSRGEYIFFVDSDDAIHKYAIESLYGAMKKEQEIDLAVGNYCKVASLSEIEQHNGNIEFVKYDMPNALEKYLSDNTGQWVVAWCKLFKRHLFENIQFPVGKKHEDEYTTYKLLFQSRNVVVTEQILYYYLQRTNSIMAQRSLESDKDLTEALLLRSIFLKESEYRDLYEKSSILALIRLKKYIEKVVLERKQKEYHEYIKKILIIWFKKNSKILNCRERIYMVIQIIRSYISDKWMEDYK